MPSTRLFVNFGAHFRSVVLPAATCALVVLLAACSGGSDDAGGDATAPTNDTLTGLARYAGVQACEACHKEIYDDYIKTSHFRSSAHADLESIHGSFEEGRNIYQGQENRRFAMLTSRDGQPYQAEEYKQRDYWLRREAHHFDIVIGSGKKGQTYLFWMDSLLYQLPISYNVAADTWILSPGYTDEMANFRRPVGPRCIECHGSYLEPKESRFKVGNMYDRETLVLGISCEKCHGPAANHVQFHQAHPQEKTAKHIVNPPDVSRQRQLDVCALCHSGHHTAIKPTFGWEMGAALDSFLLREPFDPEVKMDVHGNQVGLFMQSKCFQESPDMTCTTCHDMHKNEVGQTKTFSQRCLNCHTVDMCNMAPQVGEETAADNCIDCHMPNGKSDVLLMQVGKDMEALVVRTHHIAVYPQASEAFIRAH